MQKTISQLESKKSTEGLDHDTGATYIHTQAARGILMQKLMEGRNLDLDQMGMGEANAGGIHPSRANVLPEQQATVQSNCIVISNMFDPKLVDLEKDPSFYLEIKE